MLVARLIEVSDAVKGRCGCKASVDENHWTKQRAPRSLSFTSLSWPRRESTEQKLRLEAPSSMRLRVPFS
jgi:hypothetical protein